MEVLSGRVLLRPRDRDRSVAFYRDVLGLAIYREYGQPGASGYGVVFFMGGNYLEVSGSADSSPSENLELWFQVRDVDAVHRSLTGAGVEIVEGPDDKPWGLREMRIADPDGVGIVVVQVPEDHPLRRRT